MTSNQRRAHQLATSLLSGEVAPDDLSDADWALLMLAGDLHNVRASPRLVAKCVLANYEAQIGYFAPRFTSTPARAVAAYN